MKSGKSSKSNQKLPKFLQPFLWSVKIGDLDLARDRIYIIHQILAFGNMEALRWLFRSYSQAEIKEVFGKYSMKVYNRPVFNFVKNVILGLNKNRISQEKYVSAIY